MIEQSSVGRPFSLPKAANPAENRGGGARPAADGGAAQERPARGRNNRPMGSSRSRAAASRAGVTLLAMLLTLTCLAVVAGLAIPAFFNLYRITLDHAARLLARDIHVAQNLALFE